MSVIRRNRRERRDHPPIRRNRHSGPGVWAAVALLPLIAGCSAAQLGPERPITIEEDVVNIRPVAEPSLANFYELSLARQASARNQIITARMYISDLEYHKYEAKLTRDMQEEGLAATLTSLGLTSTASLITVASTSRILAGAATAVTGADKAFSDKVLLSNTIQALQAQMRTDRQTQAAEIFSKMTLANGQPTPIDQYTLPMALSDVDHYYQAGTLASALIGLNKTVASAEQKATTARDIAGPNADAVTQVRQIADPPRMPTPPPAALSRVYVATAATDSSYQTLRALLFPNGKRDAALVAYVEKLFSPKNVAVGAVLTTSNDPKSVNLRNRIIACVTAHNAGSDACPEGSLSNLVQ